VPIDVPIFLSAFVTLFVIMDPPGAIPIFLALTRRLHRGHNERPRAALRSWRWSSSRRSPSSGSGSSLLHISVAALQGAGGLLLLIVALQLLTGEESEQHADAGSTSPWSSRDPALAGPGAIVATMLAMQRARGRAGRIGLPRPRGRPPHHG
jgi:multiple antibiotic resistance protein